jgi:hypothetical protein
MFRYVEAPLKSISRKEISVQELLAGEGLFTPEQTERFLKHLLASMPVDGMDPCAGTEELQWYTHEEEEMWRVVSMRPRPQVNKLKCH